MNLVYLEKGSALLLFLSNVSGTGELACLCFNTTAKSVSPAFLPELEH